MPNNSTDTKTRLNKLISQSGLFSRREADKVIEEGRVVVNGKRVYELGVKVNSAEDRITVDGKPLKKHSQNLYLLFYKPRGVLVTMEDPLNRPTISEFLSKVPARVYPVGRLDWDSEGLILLTNDGDFAQKVTHPKHEVTKTYLVKLSGQPQPHHIEKLKRGVSIIGGKVAARHIEKAKVSGDKKSDKYDWYKIVISEGKNRQVRQMFAKIGLDVLKLQRIAIGKLRAGGLKAGDLVYLNDVAIEQIFKPDLPAAILNENRPVKKRKVSTKKTTPPARRLKFKT